MLKDKSCPELVFWDDNEQQSKTNIYLVGRRVQDIVFSILAMIVLSPIMLITMIAILIDDPSGSPIYRQQRCGRDGKRFAMFKFRSMHMGAEARLNDLLKDNERDGPAFKMKEDPRITRVGRFIRKTSLDELPQLWNVLIGEMSIVGPRPPLPREVVKYTKFQKQRLCIRPGITCYWQIQPNRHAVPFEEWVRLDLKYIRERSFWVDWKIILKTFKVVISKQGD
ncbi:MAG: sugar transferase [Trichococcus flocculiformis]|jgi:lipopolysaccharide/colanic/teichoic acid biosynthesis glycosyltransferase